jgi:fatty acid desaturase/predicted heme/steroid binding protein
MGKGGCQISLNVCDGTSNLDPQESRLFQVEEVAQHNKASDCWMIFQGRVLDVSNWHDHPGGAVIFSHAGGDCTDIFQAFHSKSSYALLQKFCIGEIDSHSTKKLKPESQLNFEMAYRSLRIKMIAAGLFESNLLYYFWKVCSSLMLLGLSVACVVCFNNFISSMLGAVFLALFWQQCGWLAHDFIHHQVFQNRQLGDMMGILVGNVFQGFSLSWWKNKHNTHHAVPNLHESSPDAHDGDPDIDTMPLLAWSIKMAERARDSPWGRFFIKYQAVFYFPILLAARLSWLYQSYLYAFESTKTSVNEETSNWKPKSNIVNRAIKYPKLERFCLVLHYVWLFVLCLQMPLLTSLCFFLMSQFCCGLFLALVFGLGHNGMSVYDASKRPDFWKLQVTTTRNVTSNVFVDWFCGGLQYQVEHHLFPMVPRHNLKKTHQLVAAFCKEHNVHYHEASMWKGTLEVLSFLDGVSKHFLKEFPAM